jgi:hypothetical protein
MCESRTVEIMAVMVYWSYLYEGRTVDVINVMVSWM